jgi:hypothetical protein
MNLKERGKKQQFAALFLHLPKGLNNVSLAGLSPGFELRICQIHYRNGATELCLSVR